MTLDGTYRAILDRIEDGVAVLLVEEDGETIEEVHLEPDDLPADAAAGAVLSLEFDDGTLETVTHRPEETGRWKQELRSRFDDLAERPPERDDRDGGNAGDGSR